ncbi:MAG: pseudouridine synthase, RluA family [Haloplasmataceae bacterium]|jgi:23S rRNA pseudouridine1911/1915/1917 synthase|nr:pseudouridine synthase, RluA family [Haloplasmataceae bacterium]
MINNEQILSHTVTKSERLFDYLKDELIVSLRLTNDLIRNSNLLVNLKAVKKNIKLNVDDLITINFEDETHNYELQDIPLDIIYESDDLLIINKVPNILVHPTESHLKGTIANGVAFYFNKKGLKRKIRFVNRLDMDTSGILIVAKNAYSHQFVAKQFDEDFIVKKYLAIIDGKLKDQAGTIEDSIIRNEEAKYEVSDSGKRSKTVFKVIKEYDSYSLVECELKSGRTHQIRVHLASIGGYILGDSFYNKHSELINRQALHSHELTFVEPRTYSKKTIICELPNDMKRLL